MSSNTIYVSDIPEFSKNHVFEFDHLIDENTMQTFLTIKQGYFFIRYFVPCTSEAHRKNTLAILENISKLTGHELDKYIKSIQPSRREQNSRGSSGNPDWLTVPKDGNVQVQSLFLFDLAYSKFSQDEASKKILLDTGDSKIFDDDKSSYESLINYGDILCGVREKLRREPLKEKLDKEDSN